MADHSKILAFIARCDEPDKLKSLVKNARGKEVKEVADAAFRKLIAIVRRNNPERSNMISGKPSMHSSTP
jgi:hypothetical protein